MPRPLTAAGNAFEAFAGAVLVNWWAGGRNAFLEPTGVAKFVLIAIIAAAIGASVSASIDLGVGTSVRIETSRLGKVRLHLVATLAERLGRDADDTPALGPVGNGPPAIVRPSPASGIGCDLRRGRRDWGARLQPMGGHCAECQRRWPFSPCCRRCGRRCAAVRATPPLRCSFCWASRPGG